jgi:hypothetical protein
VNCGRSNVDLTQVARTETDARWQTAGAAGLYDAPMNGRRFLGALAISCLAMACSSGSGSGGTGGTAAGGSSAAGTGGSPAAGAGGTAAAGASGAAGNGVAGAGATTSQVVDTAGGTVTTADGVTLVVPAGALPAATTLTVAGDASAVPSTGKITVPAGGTTAAVVVGTPFLFGPEGQTFASGVTITIPFDPSKLPSGATASSVFIATAPAGSSSFTKVSTNLVDATHVSTLASHFSVYVPLANQPGGASCVSNTSCSAGQVCVNGACQAAGG